MHSATVASRIVIGINYYIYYEKFFSACYFLPPNLSPIAGLLGPDREGSGRAPLPRSSCPSRSPTLWLLPRRPRCLRLLSIRSCSPPCPCPSPSPCQLPPVFPPVFPPGFPPGFWVGFRAGFQPAFSPLPLLLSLQGPATDSTPSSAPAMRGTAPPTSARPGASSGRTTAPTAAPAAIPWRARPFPHRPGRSFATSTR